MSQSKSPRPESIRCGLVINTAEYLAKLVILGEPVVRSGPLMANLDVPLP